MVRRAKRWEWKPRKPASTTAKNSVDDTTRLPQKAASGFAARGVRARHPTAVGAGATARPFAIFLSAATAVRCCPGGRSAAQHTDSGGQTLVMSPGPPQQRLPAGMQNGTEIDPGMSQHSPLPGEQQNSLHGVQGTQVRLSRAPLPARCFVVPRVSPGDTSELRAGSAASGGGTAKYPVYDTARLPQKAASGVVARGVGARHPTTVGAGATARPFATFRSAATAVRAGKHACGEIGAAHGGCGRAASRLEARGATARRARRDADRLDRTLNVAAFSPRETAVLLPIP
jgi:hypothetical protein